MIATELVHPGPSAKLVLAKDASVEAMGEVHEQHQGGRYEPFAWWSRHFTPAQRKWSPFQRELFGVHQAIHYFLPVVKGKHFVTFTDHPPLLQAKAKGELLKHHPAAEQQLLEVGQWCHDLRHVACKHNAVGNWLSCPPHVPPPSGTLLQTRYSAKEGRQDGFGHCHGQAS